MMFAFPHPAQQVEFSLALAQARSLFLQDALGQAVETVDIALLDQELYQHAPRAVLRALAKKGLRGELIFATPCLLKANPRLLGYYRLLLGYSQKEFFSGGSGAGSFKSMETKGVLSDHAERRLPPLCVALNHASATLVEAIGIDRVTKDLLDDLTLLTLGPQLRGGANVRRGGNATVKVFEIIHDIVRKAVRNSGSTHIEVRNAAGRTVIIEFAADPDIVIREKMSKDVRNIIAIEIKGGTDYSNIHNRLGEAEKSHQKARIRGFTECWTVINVVRLDIAQAHKESPSTDRFYCLSRLLDKSSAEYEDFKQRIVSLTGIKG
ncbi:MAG: XcyI family restriction endonuclease [Thiobacillaceae bacterium]|nr:XcyI family restriction endonuclease [Thiobacillaceae bacterium]